MTPRLEWLHATPSTRARNSPALLFVHGAFCGAWCWQRYFMPWFAARGYDCWAVSLEGHGASSGRDCLSALRIEDYRRNLVATVDHIGAAPIMIGHSMGGFIIQQYLAQASLPGAAFLASVPPQGMAAATMRLMTREPDAFLKLNLYQSGRYAMGIDELRALLFSPDAPDDAVETLLLHGQQESERATMDMALPALLTFSLSELPPALVLGAADDLLIAPPDVAATASHMGVTAEILPHMGHMMMMDTRWEQVALRLLRWLETL
jgi:non-heme chloroperoxidase